MSEPRHSIFENINYQATGSGNQENNYESDNISDTDEESNNFTRCPLPDKPTDGIPTNEETLTKDIEKSKATNKSAKPSKKASGKSSREETLDKVINTKNANEKKRKLDNENKISKKPQSGKLKQGQGKGGLKLNMTIAMKRRAAANVD